MTLKKNEKHDKEDMCKGSVLFFRNTYLYISRAAAKPPSINCFPGCWLVEFGHVTSTY